MFCWLCACGNQVIFLWSWWSEIEIVQLWLFVLFLSVVTYSLWCGCETIVCPPSHCVPLPLPPCTFLTLLLFSSASGSRQVHSSWSQSAPNWMTWQENKNNIHHSAFHGGRRSFTLQFEAKENTRRDSSVRRTCHFKCLTKMRKHTFDLVGLHCFHQAVGVGVCCSLMSFCACLR